MSRVVHAEQAALRTNAAGLMTVGTLRPAGASRLGALLDYKHWVPTGLTLAADHLAALRKFDESPGGKGKP